LPDGELRVDYEDFKRVVRENGERRVAQGGLVPIPELRRRAKYFGGLQPEHFAFPSCENDHIDPTKPQKSWRSAWRRLTRAVQCASCGRIQSPAATCGNEDCSADIRGLLSSTAGLRFHDLRHHAITELAESQASDQTIMAIAGHVSPRMLARYSHVRLEAKRDALEALSRPALNAGASQSTSPSPGAAASGGRDGGYDTNNDTNRPEWKDVPAEVIEKNGRHVGTRTPDLYRVKAPTTSNRLTFQAPVATRSA